MKKNIAVIAINQVKWTHLCFLFWIFLVNKNKCDITKMASIPETSKCQYNFLGKSGLRVSNICLGAMTFGESIVSDRLIF